MALIDCTVFGTAADAIVFSLSGTYHHHPSLKKNTEMKYADWAACGAVGSGFAVTVAKKQAIFQLQGSSVPASTLMAALNAIAACVPEMPADLR